MGGIILRSAACLLPLKVSNERENYLQFDRVMGREPIRATAGR
jgi:hypothetical protein